MKRFSQRGLSLLLALAAVICLANPVRAAGSDDALEAALADTAQYVCAAVPEPRVGSIGGEWAVLGLARSGYAVPEGYYQSYYDAVEAYVKARNGILHDKKYTEYARVILALTAIGRDARDVAGYDLTLPLGDYDKTVWQGINGPIWALIALDSGDYPMPENPAAETQATRQMYLDHILDRQRSDGGWSLAGEDGAGSDPDVTATALQALAKYQDQPAVAAATQEALACLSGQQDGQGGFASWSTSNSESVVQVLVALCELGLPLDDARFVKNGSTLLDNLLLFYRRGAGFVHTGAGTGSSQMATEQALYGLAAAQRALEGRSSLYRMGDAAPAAGTSGSAPEGGPAGRDPAVRPQPVTAPGVTFPDLSGHADRAAVEALAARGIITGGDDGLFRPDGAMTRAEFATIVVRALGLAVGPLGGETVFSDVAPEAWYAPYVDVAYRRGIVSGVGDGKFRPDGTLSRQEAAVMVARAAGLCGLDTALDAAAVRSLLASFSDYVTTAAWARESLAFCYQENILDPSDLAIRPAEAIRRCEVARMLFRMLDRAELLV